MPLPTLPPIDNTVYRRYELQRQSSRDLLERARSIPLPAYRGPATPAAAPTAPSAPQPSPEAVGPQARPAGGFTSADIPNQFQSGLSMSEAMAACGPAAAIAFTRRTGRTPTVAEAVQIARTQKLWDPATGMHGAGSQQALLTQLGVPTKLEPTVDWAKVRADVEGGNPVIIDTPGHYYVAAGFDPATGKFDFGASGTALKAGKQWMTPAELGATGMGQARSALYLDNPDPQTAPSVVAQPPRPYGTVPGVPGSRTMEYVYGRDGGPDDIQPIPNVDPNAPPPQPVLLNSQYAGTDEGQAAQKYGLDPDVFFRQISQESGGRANAVSPAGARGIGQFMPATAQGVAAQMGGGITAEQIMSDRTVGLDAAAFHMRQMLDSYGGDYAKALAAYNAGPGAVAKYNGVPPYAETQAYVKKILGDSQPQAQPLAQPGMAPGPIGPNAVPNVPQRTYGTPQEQIADLMTRYGSGAPAADFAQGAQQQINDLAARYGLPAQNAPTGATTPAAAVPDYQGIANQQIAATQAARAAAAAAAVPPPAPMPEPVPPETPVPEPGPLPGETPLDRQFGAIPEPTTPYVDPRAAFVGAGGLAPEYQAPEPVAPAPAVPIPYVPPPPEYTPAPAPEQPWLPPEYAVPAPLPAPVGTQTATPLAGLAGAVGNALGTVGQATEGPRGAIGGAIGGYTDWLGGVTQGPREAVGGAIAPVVGGAGQVTEGPRTGVAQGWEAVSPERSPLDVVSTAAETAGTVGLNVPARLVGGQQEALNHLAEVEGGNYETIMRGLVNTYGPDAPETQNYAELHNAAAQQIVGNANFWTEAEKDPNFHRNMSMLQAAAGLAFLPMGAVAEGGTVAGALAQAGTVGQLGSSVAGLAVPPIAGALGATPEEQGTLSDIAQAAGFAPLAWVGLRAVGGLGRGARAVEDIARVAPEVADAARATGAGTAATAKGEQDARAALVNALRGAVQSKEQSDQLESYIARVAPEFVAGKETEAWAAGLPRAAEEAFPPTTVPQVAAGSGAEAGLRQQGRQIAPPPQPRPAAAPSLAPGERTYAYPRATEVVDGLTVRPEVPNEASIGASLSGDYTTAGGIRTVAMDDFQVEGLATDKRTRDLAAAIQASGEVNPLIVAVDEQGPYILEGGHRFDALRLLGKTEFPAKVVYEEGSAPTDALRGQLRTALGGTPEQRTAFGEALRGGPEPVDALRTESTPGPVPSAPGRATALGYEAAAPSPTDTRGGLSVRQEAGRIGNRTAPMPPATPPANASDELAQALEESLRAKGIDPEAVRPHRAALTRDGERVVAAADAGGVPTAVTPRLERIAAENGVPVTGATTPNDIVAALRNKGAAQAVLPGLAGGAAGAQDQGDGSDDERVKRIMLGLGLGAVGGAIAGPRLVRAVRGATPELRRALRLPSFDDAVVALGKAMGGPGNPGLAQGLLNNPITSDRLARTVPVLDGPEFDDALRGVSKPDAKFLTIAHRSPLDDLTVIHPREAGTRTGAAALTAGQTSWDVVNSPNRSLEQRFGDNLYLGQIPRRGLIEVETAADIPADVTSLLDGPQHIVGAHVKDTGTLRLWIPKAVISAPTDFLPQTVEDLQKAAAAHRGRLGSVAMADLPFRETTKPTIKGVKQPTIARGNYSELGDAKRIQLAELIRAKGEDNPVTADELRALAQPRGAGQNPFDRFGGTPTTIDEMMGRLDEVEKLDPNTKNWYPPFGRWFKDITGGNEPLRELVAGFFGLSAWSSGPFDNMRATRGAVQTVARLQREGNLTHASFKREMTKLIAGEGKGGEPGLIMSGKEGSKSKSDQVDAMWKFLTTGEYVGQGPKAPTYTAGALETGEDFGESFPVSDRWHYRAIGFQDGQHAMGSTAAAEYSAAVTAELARRKGWSPGQVQAALWYWQKWNDPAYGEIVQKATRGKPLPKEYLQTDTLPDILRKLGPKWEQGFRDDLAQLNERGIPFGENLKPGPTGRTYNYGYIGNPSWRITPDMAPGVPSGAQVVGGAARGAVAGGYGASQQEDASPGDVLKGAALGGLRGAVTGQLPPQAQFAMARALRDNKAIAALRDFTDDINLLPEGARATVNGMRETFHMADTLAAQAAKDATKEAEAAGFTGNEVKEYAAQALQATRAALQQETRDSTLTDLLKAGEVVAPLEPNALPREGWVPGKAIGEGYENIQATPQVTSLFRKLEAAKPGVGDWGKALWKSSLLARPDSRIRDAISASLSIGASPIERAGGGLVDPLVTGARRGYQALRGQPVTAERSMWLGEAPAMVQGMAAALPDAFRDAMNSVRYGYSANMVRPDVQVGGREVLPGALNLPGRVVGAVDAFTKPMVANGEMYAQAFAQAKAEGLQGKAFLDRAAELRINHTPEMRQAASDAADYRSFQAPSATSDWLSKQKNNKGLWGAAATWQLPFHATAINVMKQVGERNPITGPLMLGGEAVEGALRGNQTLTQRKVSEGLARIGMGSALMYGGYTLAQKDLLTGAPPNTQAERDAWARQGKEPYSIKINGTWQSYRGQQFAALLAAAYGAYDAVQNGNPEDGKALWVTGAIGAGQAFADDNWFRSITQLGDVLQDPNGKGEGFLKTQFRGLVPGPIQAMAKASDAIMRDPQNSVQAAMAVTPGLSGQVQPQQTAFGAPKERPVGQQGLQSLINPFRSSPEKVDPVETELARLQRKGKAAGFTVEPGLVRGTVSVDPQLPEVNLTPEEKTQYAADSGKVIYGILSQMIASPGWAGMKEEDKAKTIDGVVESVRKDFRNALKPALQPRAVEAEVRRAARVAAGEE